MGFRLVRTLALGLTLVALSAAARPMRQARDVEDPVPRRAIDLRVRAAATPSAVPIPATVGFSPEGTPRALWHNASLHFDRGDVPSALAVMDRFLKVVANTGVPLRTAEARLLVERALAARPAARPTILDAANALSPGDPVVALARLRLSDNLPVAAWGAIRAQVVDPPASRRLLGHLLGAVCVAATLAGALAALLLLLRHRRTLLHDVATTLSPSLRGGGLAPMLVVALVAAPAAAGLGVATSACLGLAVVMRHLAVGGRVGASLALAAIALGAWLAPVYDAAESGAADDVSVCARGGCDPESLARLEAIPSTSLDFPAAQAALSLAALADDPGPTTLERAFDRLEAVVDRAADDSAVVVTWASVSLARLVQLCPRRAVTLAELEPLWRRLETQRSAAAHLNAGVLRAAAGMADKALSERERALELDPVAVRAFIDSLPARRLLGVPKQSPTAAFGSVCDPAFRPFVEVMAEPPGPGARGPAAARSSSALPLQRWLFGAVGPVMTSAVAVAALAVALGWLVVTRRRPRAFQCARCDRAASVRRSPELVGLDECDVCLRERVIGTAMSPAERFQAAPRREVARRSARRAAVALGVLVPGASSLLVGQPLWGYVRAFVALLAGVFFCDVGALPDAGLVGAVGTVVTPALIGLAVLVYAVGLLLDVRTVLR